MKINTLLFTLIMAGVMTAVGCAAETPPIPAPAPAEPTVSEPAPTDTPQIPEMTLEELSKFNGKDGAKAYIAVDGTIYDVTDVPPWKGGTHQGKVQAGTDGSEMIKQSPHGKKVLEKLPVVGKLKE